MVSDFIDKQNRFLAFTTEEYGKVKKTDPDLPMYARVFLEYVESKEAYWTRYRFVEKMKKLYILLSLNTQKRKAGHMLGCLTTAVAMLLWLLMLSKSMTGT